MIKHYLRLLLVSMSLLSDDARSATIHLRGPGPVEGGYDAIIDHTDVVQGLVRLYCNDYANNAVIGSTWSVNLTRLTEHADLTLTRYARLPDALERYQMAAWLTTQYASHPADVLEIQRSIWTAFDHSAPAPSTTRWTSAARHHAQTMNSTDFFVVTNLAPVLPTGQTQEFLMRVPSSLVVAEPTVPEPGTLGLMSASLVGFITYRHRRHRRSPK